MSDQELYDAMENIVTLLNPVIPVLQDLGNTASAQIDQKLDNSLNKVKSQLDDLNLVITKLNNGAESNERFIVSARGQALNDLKQGIELLIKTEVKNEYNYQIQQVIAEITPLITSKIDSEFERLVDHKKIVISDHNDQVKNINDQLESQMTIIHSKLLDSIDKLNSANVGAHTRLDTGIEKLVNITETHQEALQTVRRETDTTAINMSKTLTKIHRNSVIMSQSPATMTALTAGFLALNLMLSIVYKFDLLIPMLVSMFCVGSFLVVVLGFMAWLDRKRV